MQTGRQGVEGQSVVSRGDVAEVFETPEHPLNGVACLVQDRESHGFQRRLDFGGMLAAAPVASICRGMASLS